MTEYFFESTESGLFQAKGYNVDGKHKTSIHHNLEETELLKPIIFVPDTNTNVNIVQTP